MSSLFFSGTAVIKSASNSGFRTVAEACLVAHISHYMSNSQPTSYTADEISTVFTEDERAPLRENERCWRWRVLDKNRMCRREVDADVASSWLDEARANESMLLAPRNLAAYCIFSTLSYLR